MANHVYSATPNRNDFEYFLIKIGLNSSVTKIGKFFIIPLATASLIIAGILIFLPLGEAEKKRAKIILLGTITGLILFLLIFQLVGMGVPAYNAT